MTETYILVTITRDGRVSSSTYPSKFAAENAKSIALTGKTMKEIVELDGRIKREAQKWSETHPPRPPANSYERQLVETKSFGPRGTLGLGNVVPVRASQTSPGMVEEIYPNWAGVHTRTERSIRTAVIFKDAGDNHEALNS